MNIDDLDLEAVLGRFGLQVVGDAVRLAGGEDNLNVRVATSAGDLVVRRYEETPRARVAAELELVAFLAERRFPTPPPLAADDGALFVEVEGKPVAVFPFVAGATPDTTTEALATQVGDVLARMHVTAIGWDADGFETFDRLDFLRACLDEPIGLDGAETFRCELRAYLDDAGDRLEDVLASLPAGALHHDLHPGNVLVADERVVAVLDFDEAQRAPYAIDMLRTFHYIAQEHPDWLLTDTLAAAVVRAYDRVRPLSAREWEALGGLFDLINIVDAADFVTDPSGDVHAINECRSLQVYRANRGRDFTTLRPPARSTRSRR